jgi:hypothetical protein
VKPCSTPFIPTRAVPLWTPLLSSWAMPRILWAWWTRRLPHSLQLRGDAPPRFGLPPIACKANHKRLHWCDGTEESGVIFSPTVECISSDKRLHYRRNFQDKSTTYAQIKQIFFQSFIFDKICGCTKKNFIGKSVVSMFHFPFFSITHRLVKKATQGEAMGHDLD